MRPKTFSASAFESYECPARYKMTYIGDRPPEEGSSDAGALGTACHSTLEVFVENKLYEDFKGDGSLANLKHLWTTAYNVLFSDQSRYDEGFEMLERWWRRCNVDYWAQREVLMTERKMTFPIKTSVGDIPCTYIFDRMDRLDDGSIEVIDYKTIMIPISTDDMKNKIQCRIYAVAARIMHPEAKRVWVTLDMLRHEAAGRVFSRDECVSTYKYIHELAERILEDDGRSEKLNPFCQYCPRKATCRALRMNQNTGGINSFKTTAEKVDARAEVEWAIKAMTGLKADLDDQLMAVMQTEDVMELEGVETLVSASARKTRNVDPSVVREIVGDQLFGIHGKINMKEIDALLKGDDITPEQKLELRDALRIGYGEPSLKIKQKET